MRQISLTIHQFEEMWVGRKKVDSPDSLKNHTTRTPLVVFPVYDYSYLTYTKSKLCEKERKAVIFNTEK